MSLQELPRGQWQRFFDEFSRALVGQRAELDVVSLEIGDRIEARWVPLLGVVYEPRADVLEIVLEGIDHPIREPREIYIERTPRGLVTLEIIAADETRQIVKLREPLLLPGVVASQVDE